MSGRRQTSPAPRIAPRARPQDPFALYTCDHISPPWTVRSGGRWVGCPASSSFTKNAQGGSAVPYATLIRRLQSAFSEHERFPRLQRRRFAGRDAAVRARRGTLGGVRPQRMPGRLSGARAITTPLGRSIAIGVMLYSRSTCDHGEHRAGIDFSVTLECTQDVPRPVLWVYFGSKFWGKYLILLVGAPRFELGTPSPPDWCANRAALRSAAAIATLPGAQAQGRAQAASKRAVPSEIPPSVPRSRRATGSSGASGRCR